MDRYSHPPSFSFYTTFNNHNKPNKNYQPINHVRPKVDRQIKQQSHVVLPSDEHSIFIITTRISGVIGETKRMLVSTCFFSDGSPLFESFLWENGWMGAGEGSASMLDTFSLGWVGGKMRKQNMGGHQANGKD
jgi:hypothetical protein